MSQENLSENKRTYIIGEIGINHNGSIDECKRLIMLSKCAGCDYVKIQSERGKLFTTHHL